MPRKKKTKDKDSAAGSSTGGAPSRAAPSGVHAAPPASVPAKRPDGDGPERMGLALCDAEARRAEVESLNERLRSELQGLRVEVAELRAQIDIVAATDAISGALNRRAFLDAFRKEWHRARRYGRPLAVIMTDIDQFKVINDGYGSEFGDRILRLVAQSLQKAARGTDVIGRYGGDSFGIVLPETDPQAARRVAERLRKGLENAAFEHKTKGVLVTASFGVACSEEGDPEPEALLLRADDHLYQAKRAGRNVVVDDES